MEFKHSFEVKDENSIHLSGRSLAPRHNDVVREELDKELKAVIITPPASPWSLPVVTVSKNDGMPRFCVEHRALSQRMKADRWPLFRDNAFFDDPKGSHCFSSLDWFSGY